MGLPCAMRSDWRDTRAPPVHSIDARCARMREGRGDHGRSSAILDGSSARAGRFVAATRKDVHPMAHPCDSAVRPMPYLPGPEAVGLAYQAQRALGLTQLELAGLLGLSRRTVSRWGANRSRPSASELQKLARAVHPKDPALAARLAREGGETLESLGIVAPPAPVVAAPSPAPVVAVRPFPPARLVVESVVCAAAEAMQASPAAVRGVLRAAFARARGLGLTVEEMDEALTQPEEPKPPTSRGKRA